MKTGYKDKNGNEILSNSNLTLDGEPGYSVWYCDEFKEWYLQGGFLSGDGIVFYTKSLEVVGEVELYEHYAVGRG